MAEKDEDICAELARDKETVKLWVLNYASRKKEYYEDIKYIRDQLPGPAGLKRLAGSGSQTEWKVVRTEDLDEAEKWLLAVEAMQSTLSEKKLLFLSLRREAHRKTNVINWANYVRYRYARAMSARYGGTEERFCPSDTTLYTWWDEILDLTRLIAYKRGCRFF